MYIETFCRQDLSVLVTIYEDVFLSEDCHELNVQCTCMCFVMKQFMYQSVSYKNKHEYDYGRKLHNKEVNVDNERMGVG